ncbi:MAG: NADH-quinone oxidoreductase subunit L, partial [Planctomycetota bacterium]
EVTTYYGEPFRRAGRLHRFYQHLSLFTFAMLGIVVSGNALQTFVFWELVGATSYLLIGFYYERPKAAAAANKAMLVNRVGDVGMLIGLMALWSLAGTLEYRELFARAGEWLATPGDAYSLLAIAAGGMVLGCVGKSAQAPLWSWLPDAMAGPTPVSALVHSATMVAAGVFLIARLTPLMPVEVLQVVAAIGAVTLLLGAVLATAATDLKRVLAFSTISQLGFMTLSLGLGGWTAALFHLVTHASFKALLFLGAGSVMHGVHTGDLSAMGGLRRAMPRTAVLMGVGLLALIGAGLPIVGVGLSGFYSKDAIFEQAIVFSRANPAHAWLFWAPLVGAGLTAMYATRLWLVVFTGGPRSAAARDAHESGAAMLAPMAVLAVLAVAAGWALPFAGVSIQSLVETATPGRIAVPIVSPAGGWATLPPEATGHTAEVRRVAGLTASGVTLLGVIAGWLLHRGGRPLTTPAGKALRGFDLRGVPAVDRAIDAVGRAAGATVATGLDRGAIDGGLASATRLLRRGGRLMQAAETGSVRQYVSFLALGVVVVCIATLTIARQWIGEG